MMNSHSNFSTELLAIEDEDFVWSYSRIKAYENCKYAWFLKYLENEKDSDMFFSEYGSFIHELYSRFLNGEITKSELVEIYLLKFKSNVKSKAPSDKIFTKYFQDGLNALTSNDDLILMKDDDSQFLINKFGNLYDVCGTEVEVNFKVGTHNFTGFIDLILRNENGELIIVDHKSRTLKPRSKRAKPTKSDEMLDDYFKQLYIYSIATKQLYGSYPKELWLHCFRNEAENMLIKEEFYLKKLEDVIRWVDNCIEEIAHTDKWTPKCDTFFCNHLCGLKNKCEYYELADGKF